MTTPARPATVVPPEPGAASQAALDRAEQVLAAVQNDPDIDRVVAFTSIHEDLVTALGATTGNAGPVAGQGR